MFARVSAASVEQENAVNMMQLDMMRLQTLQTQIGNVSLQATLIIGFAVGMLCGDNMVPLMDDQGPRCLFKSWAHMLLGALFFLSVTACVAFCFVVVVLASYLKQASQQSALLVSTRAAHANTQIHIREVFQHFVRAITCFIISAALLIWIFAGLPSRVPYSNANTSYYNDDGIEALDTGAHNIMCLDKHSASDNKSRDNYMLALSGATTLLIVVMVAWGYRTYAAMQATYEPRQLLSWYSRYRLEQRRIGKAIDTSRSRDTVNGPINGGPTLEDANGDSDLESLPDTASAWTPATGTAPLLASPPAVAPAAPDV